MSLYNIEKYINLINYNIENYIFELSYTLSKCSLLNVAKSITLRKTKYDAFSCRTLFVFIVSNLNKKSTLPELHIQ